MNETNNYDAFFAGTTLGFLFAILFSVVLIVSFNNGTPKEEVCIEAHAKKVELEQCNLQDAKKP